MAAFPVSALRLPRAAKMAAFPVSGGVPSQWRHSMESATGGWRVARWEFHFLAGDQDTQDTQDTQDGGKIGLRAEGLSH